MYVFHTGIGDRCTNYMQECNGLVNSVCADGRCVCKIGYYEEDDLCYAGNLSVL